MTKHFVTHFIEHSRIESRTKSLMFNVRTLSSVSKPLPAKSTLVTGVVKKRSNARTSPNHLPRPKTSPTTTITINPPRIRRPLLHLLMHRKLPPCLRLLLLEVAIPPLHPRRRLRIFLTHSAKTVNSPPMSVTTELPTTSAFFAVAPDIVPANARKPLKLEPPKSRPSPPTSNRPRTQKNNQRPQSCGTG